MPDGPLDFQLDPGAQPGDVLSALADLLLDLGEAVEAETGDAGEEGERE